MDASKGSSSSGSSSERALLNYKMGKKIGMGAFCKVKVAQHVLTGKKVAIKIYRRSAFQDNDEEKVRREIEIMRLLSHPHVVHFYEVVETRHKIYVVMEYMDRGELYYYIMERRKLEEDEARIFFQQIISGLEYCHFNKVVHRDLKPENLLLDSRHNIKIADFGFGNFLLDGHFLKTSCGSLNYASPEVISGQLYAGPEVDVWSCGVILYTLVCGIFPFDQKDNNFSALFTKIKKGVYTIPAHLSPGVRDLISRILIVDPIKRATIPEILQHAWFREQLPRYLDAQPVNEKQRVRKIDEKILYEVIKLGFDMDEVIDSLRKGTQDKGTVTYNLLLDSRLGDAFRVNELQAREHMNHPEVYLRHQFPAERKYVLGFQFRAFPREIMTKVLKALQRSDVHWKKIGHYNMKCRSSSYPYLSRAILGMKSKNAVKFEIQFVRLWCQNIWVQDWRKRLHLIARHVLGTNKYPFKWVIFIWLWYPTIGIITTSYEFIWEFL